MIDFLLPLIASIFLINTIAIALALSFKNTSIIDLFWGISISISISVVLATQNLSLFSTIFMLLVILWALRLSLFLLFTRILQGKQDRRYQKIAQNWQNKKWLHTSLHFYMQGLLQILICLVAYPIYAHNQTDFALIQLLAIVLFITALLGESIADWQLYQFQKSTQKGVFKSGLWSISRHPNYFFEFLIWLSLAFYGLTSPDFYIAWLSPISIWIIMRYITAPYSEKISLEKRTQQYLDYQKKVPMIIPHFKNLIYLK